MNRVRTTVPQLLAKRVHILHSISREIIEKLDRSTYNLFPSGLYLYTAGYPQQIVTYRYRHLRNRQYCGHRSRSWFASNFRPSDRCLSVMEHAKIVINNECTIRYIHCTDIFDMQRSNECNEDLTVLVRTGQTSSAPNQDWTLTL